MSAGYYGRPMIKPPEWTDLIPAYFFTGGLAGAAAPLAFSQRLTKNDELARTMLFGAAGAAAVSAVFLIADLKRPSRFLNMLRVFKITSPMSVGVYIFGAFSTASILAAAGELTGFARPLGRVCEAVAAILGPPLSCYTAVLIADTSVPAWHYGKRSLPALFAATSAASAGAFGMICTPASGGAARRLAILGGASTLFALRRLHGELGPRQSLAYEMGQAKPLSRIARSSTVAGIAAAALAKRLPALRAIAGVLLLTGAVCEKFAVHRAGCVSAKDPSFTIDAQR